MDLTLKTSTLYISISLALTSLTSISATAIDLSSLSKASTDEIKTAAKSAGLSLETSDMIGYAAKQLNLSETSVSGGFSSLLKVAKDNLSSDDFSLISKAIPDAKEYLDKAPEVAKSSMSSLFSSAGDLGKTAESADYLDSAFKQLGLSTDQIPGLLNSFSGYLEKSGYPDAAAKLKQGLSFL